MQTNQNNSYLEQILFDLKADGVGVSYDASTNEILLTVDDDQDISSDTIAFLKSNKSRLIDYFSNKNNALSFEQLSIFLADQLDNTLADKYNMPLLLKIEGNISHELLKLSIEKVVNDYKNLNSTFVLQDGNILSTYDSGNYNLVETINLKNADFNNYINKVVSTKFKLDKFPCYIMQLIITEDSTYAFFIFHHILIDGYSLTCLVNEIFKYYEGSSSPLLNGYSYRDYIFNQKTEFYNSDITRCINHWNNELANVETPELPFQFSSKNDIQHDAANVTQKIDENTLIQINQYCKTNNISKFTFFSSVIYLLFTKLTKSYDQVFMVPFIDTSVLLNKSIGMYTNIWPLRINLPRNLDLKDLYHYVLDKMSKITSFSKAPSNLLFNKLKVPHSILSNILINYFHDNDLDYVGNSFSVKQQSIYDFAKFSKYNLSFYISESTDISINLVYKDQLFNKIDMITLMDQYVSLIKQIVLTKPDANEGLNLLNDVALSVLPDPQKILNESIPFKNVCTPIANAIKRYSSNSAIRMNDESITYSELEIRVVKWINFLLSSGVNKSSVIAINSEKNFDFIYVSLATMAIGGILYYFEDKAIDDYKLQCILSEFSEVYLVNLKEMQFTDLNQKREIKISEFPNSNDLSLSNLIVDVDSEQPGYIFFTSGTTGTPKPILGRHYSLINFVLWQQQKFNITSKDNIAQLAGVTFDAILREIFLPLISGATLHICGEANRYTDKFFEWISLSNISILHMVPSVLEEMLLSVSNKKFVYNLRYIFLSGEKVKTKLVKELIEQLYLKPNSLINFYGCTEGTMIQGYSKISGIINDRSVVHDAVSNYQFLVLNDNNSLCSINELGQVAIRSKYLSLGYLGLNNENKNKFIKNPYTKGLCDDLLYLTGDYGYFDHLGNLNIFGRKDDQIKVHGIRVNLSYIEEILESHPSIDKAVAMIIKDSGRDEIIACIKTNSKITLNGLIKIFGHKEKMELLPRSFYLIDLFPLNKSGKIDKIHLSQLIGSGELSQVENIVLNTQQSDLEIRIAEIWQQVLRLDIIPSPQDNFFLLGGSSLLAIMIINKINGLFSVSLTGYDLLHNPTIFEFASLVENTLLSGGTERVLSEQNLVHSKYSDNKFVLSYQQFRMWMLYQIDTKKSHYHSNILLEIDGPLNIDKFKKSLFLLLEKHTILRSVYSEENGNIYQKVIELNENLVPLLFIDNKDIDTQQFLSTEIEKPFDLTKEIPIRFILTKNSQHSYQFLTIIHHIAYDNWSRNIILEDFCSFYTGKDPAISIPQLQYYDYAFSQRNDETNNFNESIVFWKNYLHNSSPFTIAGTRSLDGDKFEGNLFHVDFSSELSCKLQQYAKDHKTTVFNVLLCGYFSFLHKISNEEDIIIGTHLSSRTDSTKDIVGYFANIVPLRMIINNSNSFDELTKTFHLQMLQVFKHQSTPYEVINESLSSKSDLLSNLFNLLFSFQDSSTKHDLEVDDLLIKDKIVPYNTVSDFDLSIYAYESNSLISAWVQYSQNQYDEWFLKYFIDGYQSFLLGLLNNSAQALNGVNLLSYSSQQDLFVEWNHTAKTYPEHQTIHQMFEEQVVRTPNNIAVVYEDSQLTYNELNQEANQLAHYLRDTYQIQGDDLIALCLERSEQMLIAILAVLKAGGAYVPMDPNYPEERLSYILADTKAKVVLANEIHSSKLTEIIIGDKLEARTEIIDGVQLSDKVSNYSLINPNQLITSSNLAYVIYTSGTTGRPKGVALQHQGIINRIHWMNEEYPLAHTDKILQKTPYVFDVSVWELFWANWYGASIVFAKAEGHKDADYLVDLIHDKQISVIHFVPSMLDVFNQNLGLQNRSFKLDSLRYIFCSGEALQLVQVKQVHKLLPEAQLHNLYGPTEASVDVLYYDCSDKALERVYIGKPIANTTAYVLDANLTPLPIGTIGELYIGGDGLARGYLNLPELTAERFIVNPFQSQTERQSGKNARLYKTGDLARYLADGNIEYIGRNDFQVKIRGFRIELGEIEAKLAGYSEVKQAVVLAKEHLDQAGAPTGNKYLVGYYIADNKLDESLILDYLNQYLPEYMVPSVLVHLEALPLTVNGKLDRKGLPDPEFTNTDNYVAPGNEMEIEVCQIWEELLGVKKIGIYDNFFRLGGNSINYIKMLFMINSKYSTNFKIHEFLNDLTIEYISKKLSLIQGLSDIQNKEDFLII